MGLGIGYIVRLIFTVWVLTVPYQVSLIVCASLFEFLACNDGLSEGSNVKCRNSYDLDRNYVATIVKIIFKYKNAKNTNL
jgi:hypothetical protein